MATTSRKLSIEQQSIFDKITVEKKNIFFTGCGGTGKSFLLKHLIEYYHTTYSKPESVAITASTGRAAFSIGGVTLHSFAGLGLGKEDVNELISKATFNKKVNARWKTTQVLIIDEVSMLDANYFDKLDKVAKTLKNNKRPFGGIQLILTGDLLQLPPVSEGGNHKLKIFQADCWSSCIDEYVVLWEVFRQSDLEFTKALAAIRLGGMTQEIADYISNLSREQTYDTDSGPVNLFATRAKADKFNQENLDRIDSPSITYMANDTYKKGSKVQSTTLDSCPAPASLELKIGAQVMLIKNINKDLVNGTVGVVIGFSKVSEELNNRLPNSFEQLPIVQFELSDGRIFTRGVTREVWSQTLPTGEEVASRRQIPLILAWAVTIHKSQGQTIERLKVDLSDVFECGQVYTALSRATDPNGLQVIGWDPGNVKVDTDALNFCLDNNLV